MGIGNGAVAGRASRFLFHMLTSSALSCSAAIFAFSAESLPYKELAAEAKSKSFGKFNALASVGL
jgi:hypothetical protein